MADRAQRSPPDKYMAQGAASVQHTGSTLFVLSSTHICKWGPGTPARQLRMCVGACMQA